MRFIKGDSLKEAIEHFHTDASLKTDPGRRSLELRKLLRRFVDVCNAIDYAHSRGVLHRDIKPGNVIVGKHGETLVVDWGLAKARGRTEPGAETDERTLRPSSASGSAETLPGSALGTPAYMSPEQAVGDLDRLGPRSDVYSLGATLYCLLTGKPPFEGDDVGELLRKAQRGEFPPPQQRDAMVDKALEAVCLKAMRLRPEDRYATPRALAEDVERWMADEPTSAWREPRWRRLGRWGRRHKPVVAGAVTLLVATVVGLSIGALLINRERARAEESFKQARQAVDDYFTTVSESKLLDVPGLQPLRKELLERALNYYQGFIRQRGNDRSVRAELAATNYRVARITQMIVSGQDALAAYRQALTLYEDLVRVNPDVAKFQSDMAIVCNDLGNLTSEFGDRPEALRIHRHGLAVRETLARAKPRGARYQNELAKSHACIASLLRDEGRQAEALQAFQEARAINERAIAQKPIDLAFDSDLGKPFHTPAAIQIDLAIDYQNIGVSLGQMNQPTEAIRHLRNSEALLKQLVAEHPNVADYRCILANTERILSFSLKTAGQAAEALQLCQEAMSSFETLVKHNPTIIDYHNQLAGCYGEVAAMLAETGQPREARLLILKGKEIREKLAADQPTVTSLRRNLARSYLSLGGLPVGIVSPAEALDCLRRAETILATLPDLAPVDRYNLACTRAVILRLIGGGQRELLAEQRVERARYEALAMESLREAVAAGYNDVQNMHQDTDLDALRGRDDFQGLLRGLKERVRSDDK
jgi:serine/threonine-protein kinase